MVTEPHGVDLRSVRSGGALARSLLERLALAPPLEKFATPNDASLDQWQQAVYGGWCAVCIQRWPIPVVDVDINDAYPTVAALLGWWDHVAAAELVESEVTEELIEFLREPDELEDRLLDPSTWSRWGLTLVEVHPEGEPFPILRSQPGADPRLDITDTTSPERPLHYTWPDVALATLGAGHVPNIRSATQLRSLGRQHGLRTASFLDLTIAPRDNPARALVKRRHRARQEGDKRLTRTLRVIANALVWGECARTDPSWCSDGHRVRRIERPGPWCWPPLAATIPAACRLVLAMLDRQVTRRGGQIAYRDTDGAAIVAAPEHTSLEIPHAPSITALSWSQVDSIIERFRPLGTADAAPPFWKIRRGSPHGPWWGIFIARKRWVFFTQQPPGRVTIEDASEHGLAGTLLAPPNHPNWSHQAAQVLAETLTRPAVVQSAPFSTAHGSRFPALRRRTASRPDELAALPDALGLRPFGAYLQALPAVARAATPIAPAWPNLQSWESLDWFDRDGRLIRVSTDTEDVGAVPLETLETKALGWGGHELLTPSELLAPEPVTVHPALIRRVGRAGGKYRGDHTQLTYADIDVVAVLLEGVERLGVRAVSNLTGMSAGALKSLRAGATPRRATIEAALQRLADAFADAPDPVAAFIEHERDTRQCRGCGDPLIGRQQQWCSQRCRVLATRRARRT
jgi:hypothetical protein